MFKIIVVGAGAAGIAATTRLLETNVSDIAVLEAEGRVGGRVYTTYVDGNPVEFGAEWVHGERGNVVYDLASKHNLIVHNYRKRFWPVYSGGESIENDTFAYNLLQFGYEVHPLEKFTDEEVKLSLGEVFLRRYKKLVLDRYRHDPKRYKFAVEAIHSIESRYLDDQGAFSWYTIPVVSSYEDVPGDEEMNWKGVGYETILHLMMRTYKTNSDVLGIRSKIWLHKKVTSIDWSQEESNRVIIKCQDGSIYTADQVIFTPSVGVLKAEHRTLFRPALPSQKQTAISLLGLDAIMKIICVFRTKWWRGIFGFRPVVWTIEDRASMPQQFPHGPLEDAESWLTYICFIQGAQNHPNALVAWVRGSVVPKLERTPLHVIKEGMVFLFRKLFGGTHNITQLQTVLRFNWYNHPNFRGAFSFETLKGSQTNTDWHQILAEPLVNHSGTPLVMFAGEASQPYHFSTVHGAIESGYREAHRILNSR